MPAWEALHAAVASHAAAAHRLDYESPTYIPLVLPRAGLGRFHSDDLDKEFTWSGEIGEGFHPDPSIGFAEGKFYAIMQKETDFVSPGPWVDGVEARAGVDTDGDGKSDQWTEWQSVQESYSQKPGFARIVDVQPATLETSSLPAGTGFQFQYRSTSLPNGVQPIMDRVELVFGN